ncbi:MAG: hypothetical protein MZV63_20910 [Marinilabiliales bacterium]|nr:hypothetical protein [Marinilabiliales bacterium]
MTAFILLKDLTESILPCGTVTGIILTCRSTGWEWQRAKLFGTVEDHFCDGLCDSLPHTHA